MWRQRLWRGSPDIVGAIDDGERLEDEEGMHHGDGGRVCGESAGYTADRQDLH